MESLLFFSEHHALFLGMASGNRKTIRSSAIYIYIHLFGWWNYEMLSFHFRCILILLKPCLFVVCLLFKNPVLFYLAGLPTSTIIPRGMIVAELDVPAPVPVLHEQGRGSVLKGNWRAPDLIALTDNRYLNKITLTRIRYSVTLYVTSLVGERRESHPRMSFNRTGRTWQPPLLSWTEQGECTKRELTRARS
jgi:hypothetical protein